MWWRKTHTVKLIHHNNESEAKLFINASLRLISFGSAFSDYKTSSFHHCTLPFSSYFASNLKTCFNVCAFFFKDWFKKLHRVGGGRDVALISRVEQLGYELVPRWDAGVTGSRFTHLHHDAGPWFLRTSEFKVFYVSQLESQNYANPSEVVSDFLTVYLWILMVEKYFLKEKKCTYHSLKRFLLFHAVMGH